MIKDHQSLVDMLHHHQMMREESKMMNRGAAKNQQNMDPFEERITGMSEAQLKQELLSKFKIIGMP